MTKKHTEWVVSIIALKTVSGKQFKVTRRFPELSVSETKIFSSEKEAKKQFEEWLNQ